MTRDDLALAALIAALTAAGALAALYLRRHYDIAAIAGHAAGIIDGARTYGRAYARAAARN